MQATFETITDLPALTDGFSFAEIEVQVTVKGDIDGYAVDGCAEWDFCITDLEGWARKSTPENRIHGEYQKIEKGSWLYTILTAQLEKDPSCKEQAKEALLLVLLSHKNAAE